MATTDTMDDSMYKNDLPPSVPPPMGDTLGQGDESEEEDSDDERHFNREVRDSDVMAMEQHLLNVEPMMPKMDSLPGDMPDLPRDSGKLSAQPMQANMVQYADYG